MWFNACIKYTSLLVKWFILLTLNLFLLHFRFPCAATNHPHHENSDDSIYKQNILQGKFFKALREKNVFINQPDLYFYQGGSKTGKCNDSTHLIPLIPFYTPWKLRKTSYFRGGLISLAVGFVSFKVTTRVTIFVIFSLIFKVFEKYMPFFLSRIGV